MKKQFLFIAFLCIYNIVKAQCSNYVYIPDANFKAVLVNNTAINTDNDTEISCSEAEAITVINFSSEDVTDLTGIEHFTNLEELSCSINNITSVDLSANTLLRSLSMNSNPITSIDLSANINLRSLSMNTTRITNIDLSANTLLTVISINSTDIEALDVSKNTALVYLSFSWTKITSIDLTNNPQLTTLRCFINSLETLDLSKNTLLKSVDCYHNSLKTLVLPETDTLEELSCYSNNLTFLNVSKNTNLKTLKCYENNLVFLDLAHNINLETVYVNDNNLKQLNVANGNNTNISNFIARDNIDLNCIKVDDADFSTNNWGTLNNTSYYSEDCSFYVHIPDANLKTYILDVVDIDSDGEINYAEIEYLSGLRLNSILIEDFTGIEAIVNLRDITTNNAKVETIDFSNNINLQEVSISDGLINRLDLSENTNLSSLTIINNNDFTDLDISKNTNLSSIHISNNNNFTDLDISKNINLISIRVSGNNNFTNLDVSKNINLTSITCGDNKLSNIDISKNNKLTYLDCRNNNLTNLDLSTKTNLTFINCSGNNFTSLDLSANINLTALVCTDNSLTSLETSNLPELQFLLCSDNLLTKLDISANPNIFNLHCDSNALTYLNIANGNNDYVDEFDRFFVRAINNPDLACIQVDDAEYSNANWTNYKDHTASFSENCPTTKWLGTINNDWHTTTNWSTNIVPTTTDDVEIPSGLSNYPTVSAEIAVNSISLLNNATLIANAPINTSNVTYSKTLNENWYLATSPLSGETFNNLITNNTFATGTDANIGLGIYNNNGGDAWSYKTSDATGTIDTSLGISLKLATAGDVIFSGNVNTTTVTYPITTGDRTDFNLIGNPFTSYINSETFINSNTLLLKEKSIWVWNGVEYETYNLANTTEIAPTQAFFIEASADGIISFDYDNQSHATTDTAAKQEVYPNIELSVNTLNTKLFFIDGKTAGFDNGYDGSLFTDTQSDFTLYTKLVEDDNSGKKLAIQTLGSTNLESMVIPVGINAKAGNELNFSIKTLNLEAGLSVYLEDKIKGTFINLTNNDYKATIETDIEGSNNYSLHLSAISLSTQDNITASQNIIIYKNADNKITVTGLKNNATLKVYSLLGTLVANANLTTYSNSYNLPNLSSGLYIIKVNSIDGEKTKKIILN